MTLPVLSHVGIGPLTFGMTREEVEHAVGSRPHRFRKTLACATLTDAFDGAGMHVYYDDQDRVEAIELFAPARPTFNDHDLHNMPYSSLIAAIRILDPEVQEDELGFTSNALGFGVYTEAKDTQPEQPAEAVIVFRKDYYAGS